MIPHPTPREHSKHADGVIDRSLQRMVVQARIVAPIAEVQMLRDSGPQGGGLSNVDTHALVQAQNAVEVDGAHIAAQVSAYEFECVERLARREVGPYLGANAAEYEVVEVRVP